MKQKKILKTLINLKRKKKKKILRCIKNNFKVISEDVTVYRKVDDSIMVNIKKYSKKWWVKRKEAHEFMKNFFLKNQLVYENKFDYYLTDKISKFLS